MFIKEFFEAEYVSSKSRYDVNLSEEEHDQKVRYRMKNFFHSILSSSMNSYLRGKHDLSEISLVKYKKPEKVQKRTLFQIKKYENPVCGDIIQRVLKDNIIYRCYADRDKKTKKGLVFSCCFFAAETDEGLRIVYYNRFFEGVWDKLSDYEPSEIKKFGKLLDVKKYQAPEEEYSLQDYNDE